MINRRIDDVRAARELPGRIARPGSISKNVGIGSMMRPPKTAQGSQLLAREAADAATNRMAPTETMRAAKMSESGG